MENEFNNSSTVKVLDKYIKEKRGGLPKLHAYVENFTSLENLDGLHNISGGQSNKTNFVQMKAAEAIKEADSLLKLGDIVSKVKGYDNSNGGSYFSIFSPNRAYSSRLQGFIADKKKEIESYSWTVGPADSGLDKGQEATMATSFQERL